MLQAHNLMPSFQGPGLEGSGRLVFGDTKGRWASLISPRGYRPDSSFQWKVGYKVYFHNEATAYSVFSILDLPTAMDKILAWLNEGTPA